MALVNNPVMGINLRQNKNSKNAGYGKYYPEVDLQKTLTIRGFAQHLIDHGSKYSRGDIENILSMVTECDTYSGSLIENEPSSLVIAEWRALL